MDTENRGSAADDEKFSHSGNAARGRPFAKGNPGRKRGSKNKRTLLATALAEGEGEELLRKAIEMAKGGNVALIKFLLDRILPKERPIQLKLPPLDWAHDSIDAMAEIVNAVSSGRITPREAADIAQVLSAFTQAIDVTDTEQEIESLKSAVLGLQTLPDIEHEDEIPTSPLIVEKNPSVTG